MKKKAVSLLLVLTLVLGLAVPAMAYSTPDFSDVPSNHWAYEAVMKMADAGVIKGTGNGEFSPEMKLSAEMFIVLVGRVVFPEVKAEGADWSAPYVSAAKNQGLLTGTNVTDSNLKGEISRYDMAVILAKCVEILKISATKADSSKVTDYGELPTKYVDAVLMAYGSGLIRGDQTGSFNGQNSMTRQEAATVMDRLLSLKSPGSQGGTTEPTAPPEPSATSEPEKPTESEKPTEKPAPEVWPLVARGELICCQSDGERLAVEPGVPFKIFYTEDNGNTQTCLAEGKTTLNVMGGQSGTFNVEFEADINMFDTENGRFYVSAEWDYNGEHYVTPDLRTDGNAAIVPIYVHRARTSQAIIKGYQKEIAMVPPSGATRAVETGGKVRLRLDYPPGVLRDEDGNWLPFSAPCSGMTVQLCMLDWNGQERVLGEAVTDDEGQYSLTANIDVTDYIAGDARYWLEVNGDFEYQGRLYRCGPHYEPCNIELLEAWPRALAPTDFMLHEVED